MQAQVDAKLASVPSWTPEVTVDEPLVRALLREQVPELAGATVRRLSAGAPARASRGPGRAPG